MYLKLASILFAVCYSLVGGMAVGQEKPSAIPMTSVALNAGGNEDPDLDKLRGELEAAASRYTHLATSDFVRNREINLPFHPKFQKLAQQQIDLAKDLQQWGEQPELVRKLIKHVDPKVRTLVIATLYARLDGRDLPYIASLAKDKAPTFKYLHDPFSAGGYTGDLAEIEDPQTVGDVAGKMLSVYYKAVGEGGDRDIEQFDFDRYWSVRAKRKTCASWLLVQVEYATRSTSPLQPQYKNDVAAAIAKIKALPPNERAWTQLFIKTRSFTNVEEYLSNADCLAALKEVGPDQIMKFLNCMPVVDDPDLSFKVGEEDRGRVHFWMALFVLRNAKELLRVEDVPSLLELETFQRENPTLLDVSSEWAAAAAELAAQKNTDTGVAIIDAALKRFPMTEWGGKYQAPLVASLWRINGTKAQAKIVDWCYAAQANVTQNKRADLSNGLVDLLQAMFKEDKKQATPLLTKLIHDPRSEQLDWYALRFMLEIVNEGRNPPLVTPDEFHASGAKSNKTMDEWRKKLKQELKK